MGEVISSDDIDMPEMPDPEGIPEAPIDKSTAFSGKVAPIKKDPFRSDL